MFKSLNPWRKRNDTWPVRYENRQPGRGQAPLSPLEDELDALADRLFSTAWDDRGFGDFPRLWDFSSPQREASTRWKETDREYMLETPLPGFATQDLHVTVSGNVLSVRAERKEDKTEKGGEASYRYGSYSRAITLPQGVDLDRIKADYRSGVLEIHLPKSEETRGRRIEVTAG